MPTSQEIVIHWCYFYRLAELESMSIGKIEVPWPGFSSHPNSLANCAHALGLTVQVHACTPVGNKPLLPVLLYKELCPVLDTEPGAEREPAAQAEMETDLLHADLPEADRTLGLDLPPREQSLV